MDGEPVLLPDQTNSSTNSVYSQSSPSAAAPEEQAKKGKPQSERWITGCNQWWLLAIVSLLIGAFGLVIISVLKVNSSRQPLDYGVVIDAGSTHSQVFVYKWEADKYNNTAIAKQIFTQRAQGGGIATYMNATEAGAALEGILNAAKAAVPTSNHAKTPLFLGATAGMRLLHASNRNQSDAIMDAVRATMAKTPFNFSTPQNQAVILKGMDEGAFGWITVNYLLERFGQTDMFTYLRSLAAGTVRPNVIGSLDLGGASTQLSFYPEKPEDLPDSSRSSLLLYGQKYDIYSHSYLCYGQTEAMRRYHAILVKTHNYSPVLTDPCRPTGFTHQVHFGNIFEVPCTSTETTLIPYHLSKNTTFKFNGASNSTECGLLIKGLFNFTAHCETPPCSFNGIHQPHIRGDYMAFSAFYYTTKAFNLTGSFDLHDFREKYTTFCTKPWSEIPHDPYSSNSCLEAHYMDTLLTDGYKFNNETWRDINFQGNVRNTDIGWSLGFMLNMSNTIPAEFPTQSVSTPLFIILVVLLACFIALAVGFALYAMSLQKLAKKYEKLTTYGSV